MSIRSLKVLVFVACLLPVAKMAAELFGLAGRDLGANPIEALLHRFGWWGLALLLATLAVSPLRKIAGWPKLIRVRRMLGLFAFFYIAMHFVIYAWLDQRWDLAAVLDDIVKRPYITIGMLGLTLMIPLAVTSTDAMMRRLGRRWSTLHRLVYPIAVLGVWHFYWQVKQDIAEPLIFAAILFALLGYRVWKRRGARRRQPESRATTSSP